MDRKILHIDMNNFYASVELLSRPDLRGKPVIVGGDEQKRRGIVLAKNEIAKKAGVKTAETLYQARQKCPGAVVLPPRHALYREYSLRAREIYRRYTERMEPFGPDEAWLDVSQRPEPAEETAREIQRVVLEELGLNVSIGVSWNKTFAKMGSDYKKPAAITVISRENYREILWPLPVGEFLFVGEATAERLMSLGIQTIGDLAAMAPEALEAYLGKHGRALVLTARGEDDAPVLTEAEQGPPKSIGAMETTSADIRTEAEAEKLFAKLAREVEARARKEGLRGRTVRITVKDRLFVTRSRQRSLQRAVSGHEDILREAMRLYREHFPGEQAIRLLGITLDNLEDASAPRQMTLFELPQKPEEPPALSEARRQKAASLDRLMEALKARFGEDKVLKGSEIHEIRDSDENGES